MDVLNKDFARLSAEFASIARKLDNAKSRADCYEVNKLLAEFTAKAKPIPGVWAQFDLRVEIMGRQAYRKIAENKRQ